MTKTEVLKVEVDREVIVWYCDFCGLRYVPMQKQPVNRINFVRILGGGIDDKGNEKITFDMCMECYSHLLENEVGRYKKE